MHEHAYKTFRGDRVENHVLVSKDLKHMQALVETFELRRADCIELIQAFWAENLNSYQKCLEEMLSGATEAKRNLNKNHGVLNFKKNFKTFLGIWFFLATRRKARKDRRMVDASAVNFTSIFNWVLVTFTVASSWKTSLEEETMKSPELVATRA